MSTPARWRISASRSIPLDRPRLIGIINTTPDSFSDGALALDPEDAADRAVLLADGGADVLDIGAESTRPGAKPVSESEQIARAVPAIRAIRALDIDLPITIDTTCSGVARAALDAGTDAINDVSGATADPAMLALAAERDCSLILMHRLVMPAEDAYSDAYDSPPIYTRSAENGSGGASGGGSGVVGVVEAFLRERARVALESGIHPEGIVIDPGLGFGKTVEQNVELMQTIPRFIRLGFPVLAGASRKSFIGAITGEDDPARRIAGSVAAAVTMAASGCRLFRVHDVHEHASAFRVAQAVWNAAPRAMEQNDAARGSSC